MEKDEKKKKVNIKRALGNNAYMLGLIAKASPGLLVMELVSAVLGSLNWFLQGTYMYMYALNALQEGKALTDIFIMLGIIFACELFFTVFRYIYSMYWDLKRPMVEAYIQNMLQKKAAEVDLACFESSAFYDTYVKAIGETSGRAVGVMNDLSGFLWVTIQASSVGILLATIDPSFLILALIPPILTLIVGKRRNRVRYEYNMKNAEAMRQRDYVRRTFYLQDFSKEMRLTEMWKVMFKRMHTSITELKEIVRKYGYKLMFFAYLFDLAFDIVVDTGTVILASYKTLVAKTLPLGDCFVAINSLSNISWCINDIGETVLKLDDNSLYIENLRSFLEYEVHIAEDESAPEVGEFRDLELRGMSFCYDGQDENALSDVSLRIRAGEKIAIVGHNGAGKTTLIKLLLRLYDPTEGEILVNGRDIREYRLSSYRELFGTVFQDYRLFAATVAENVMLRGDITDSDRECVRRALERAGIGERIESLPHGVDCGVTKEFDDEGTVFSGGEAQKISIARIFAGNQEIVIMDEPTSALDPIAEQAMYSNMFEACEGKTVIFISHRLSSATMADRVYMFEHGRIIEHGTHSELLTLNAKYADMWHKQADTYADTEEV